MDWKLELVVVPVSDIERSKSFYLEQAGFDLHVDHSAGESFRVVQLTPPGSACSIALVTGNGGMEPGTVKGLHLVVDDADAAHSALAERGTDVSDFFHFGEGGQTAGPHPDREDYGTFFSFTDPDGNHWMVQEVGRTAPPTGR